MKKKHGNISRHRHVYKNNCVFAAIPFYIQEMAVCFPITKQKEPIIIRFISCDYRLCVNASGSVITVVLNCFTLIIISRLHFGQYSGKFSSTVLSQILILVLLLQLGHNSHSFFFILCFSSDNRISMDNYIYNSRSFHRLVETITHAPTMSTVKTM